jgi:zona occludens toxin (predicted ATPase)
MAIKIHWGDNGSYKTAGCVMDDIIPAIKSGRAIITNIRGLTYEKCRTAYPDAPDSFKLISINLDSAAGLEQCRTWFKWAERGSLIVFDETQLVFLKSWKESDLKQFDYEGGIDKAFEDDRPSSWLDAWTRHRHFNWDVVLTTPNIKYIRQDIRDTSQSAFKHTNYGLLGPIFKKLIGDYKEVFHDSQSNQPTPKSISRNRRIDKKVFELYQSTATGVVNKDFAGTSIFKSLPLLLGLLICVLSIGYSVTSGGYDGLTGDYQDTKKLDVVPLESSINSTPNVPSNNVDNGPNNTSDSITKFLNLYDIRISSYASLTYSALNNPDIYTFKFISKDNFFYVEGFDLVRMGLNIEFFGVCMAKLNYKNYSSIIGCDNAVQKSASDKVDSYSF